MICAGRTRFRTAALVLAVTGLLAGCGSPDPGANVESETERKSVQLVTPAEIERARQDSPYRSLLEWWRLVQYREPAGAFERFTPHARAQLGADFAEVVYRDVGPWLQRIKPELVRAETSAGTTTLFLRLHIRRVITASLVRNATQFVAIPMRRTEGTWRIDDATFFVENGSAIQRERKRNEQAARP